MHWQPTPILEQGRKVFEIEVVFEHHPYLPHFTTPGYDMISQ